MLELKNNIFYVGVKDPTLRTFDIFMETEYGTTYNAYLVKGEKTALIAGGETIVHLTGKGMGGRLHTICEKGGKTWI